MLKKGDRISILPEYRNEGEECYIWAVVSDEEKGRVDISPLNYRTRSGRIRIETVHTYMVTAKRTASGRKISIFEGPLKELRKQVS